MYCENVIESLNREIVHNFAPTDSDARKEAGVSCRIDEITLCKTRKTSIIALGKYSVLAILSTGRMFRILSDFLCSLHGS